MNEEEDKKEENQEAEEVVEFEYNEDGDEDLKKTIKKLRSDLKLAQAEKSEYLTGWQKERADFANYKKQEEERMKRIREVLQEDILTKFLAVLDNFNMAFANKEAWEKVDPSWRQGVEYIYSQLNTIFEEHGIGEIGKEGEEFDPNLHNSIETTPSNKEEENGKISEVVQKGYKLGERVIRPANVKVYEYKDK